MFDNRWSAWYSAVLMTALLLLPSCAATEEPEPESEPVVTVEAAPVLTAPIQLKITAEAVLYPLQQAAIVSKITAPIRRFYVEPGAMVRAGQLLAELESQDLAGAVAENQAALAQAEANYQTTVRATVPQEVQKAELEVRAAKDSLDAQQKQYDSLSGLFAQGAIAQRDVNEAQVGLTQARNQYEIAQRVLQDLQGFGTDQAVKAASAQRDAAKGRLESSQVQLGYSRITSPISGVVTDRPLFAGETAASGSPIITIMDLSSVIGRAHVSQEDAAQVKIGDPANLLPQDGSAAVKGRVTHISPALDPATTTVEVWVQFSNPGARLRAGTSLRLEIIAKTEPIALVIPQTAVVTDDSGATNVMLVDSADMPKKVAVMLGIRDGDNVQVLEGLEGGDRVVTTGAFELAKLDPDVLEKTKLKIQLPKEEEEPEEDEK